MSDVSREEALKDWQSKGYDESDFSRWYERAAGEGAGPNSEAWMNALSAYGSEYGSYGSESALAAMMAMPAVTSAGVDYDKIWEMTEKNREVLKEMWPESITEGIAAAKKYDSASMEQADLFDAFNWERADKTNTALAARTPYYDAFLKSLASKTNQWNRSETNISNQWMQGQVADANKFNSEEWYSALETAMPGLQSTMTGLKASVDEMLSGELPAAVRSELDMLTAEAGQNAGWRGPLLASATARQRASEVESRISQGRQLAMNLPSVAKSYMYNPLTFQPAAAATLQNIGYMPTPVTPTLTTVSPTQASTLGANYFSTMAQQGTVAPSVWGQAAISDSNNQLAAATATASNQLSAYQTALGYSWAQQQAAQQLSMFNQSLSAQQESQYWQFAGSALSGLLSGGGSYLGGTSGAKRGLSSASAGYTGGGYATTMTNPFG